MRRFLILGGYVVVKTVDYRVGVGGLCTVATFERFRVVGNFRGFTPINKQLFRIVFHDCFSQIQSVFTQVLTTIPNTNNKNDKVYLFNLLVV